MYYTNLRARWYSNTSLKAIPMIIVPIPEGEWSVVVSAEGYQATSSTTDPNVGKVDGLIAYTDDESDVWNVGVYNNVEVTNNKADNSWKYGHPNLVVNDCHFNHGQCLERDGDISCHIRTTGSDAAFFVVGPSVQKQSKYNYAVSYGAWTDRNMELGLITIILDEKGGSRSSSLFKRPKRVGHSTARSTWGTVPMPEKEYSGTHSLGSSPGVGVGKTSQRPDYNTPTTCGSGLLDPDGLADPKPLEEEIPDYEGEPWSSIEDFMEKPDDNVSVNSRLRGILKPRGLPQPQPIRTSRDWQPNAELLEVFDPHHFDPGYSREEVAAATIIAGGTVEDGRDKLEQREKLIDQKRKSWKPSIGGSTTSSLTGGTLKLRASSEKLSRLTTAQLHTFKKIERSLGKTAASDYLESVLNGNENLSSA